MCWVPPPGVSTTVGSVVVMRTSPWGRGRSRRRCPRPARGSTGSSCGVGRRAVREEWRGTCRCPPAAAGPAARGRAVRQGGRGRRPGQQDAVGSISAEAALPRRSVRGDTRHVPYGVGPGGQVPDGDGVEQGRERFLVDLSQVEGATGRAGRRRAERHHSRSGARSGTRPVSVAQARAIDQSREAVPRCRVDAATLGWSVPSRPAAARTHCCSAPRSAYRSVSGRKPPLSGRWPVARAK